MKRFACLTICVFLLCLATVDSASANDAHLRGMQLLPGYTHVPLQGIDSIVGKIVKEGGLEISYEIGHVSKPGEPQLGGGFRDRPKLTPKGELHWYREQTIGGQPAHLAYRKDKVLLVSFPDTGMNFHATIQSSEDFADAMLMILTYPQPTAVEAAKAGPIAGGGPSDTVDAEPASDVEVKQDGKWKPAKLPLAGLAEGKAVEVKVRGTLRHGIMAIGGETTGTIIGFDKTTWELDLRKNPAFLPAAEKLSGQRVVVTGTVRAKAGVEIAKRTILTIESIDPAHD